MIDHPTTGSIFPALTPMSDSQGPLPEKHPIGEIRVRPAIRQVWLASANAPLRCGPEKDDRVSHRLGDQLAWNDGCLRCDHRDKSGRPDCNRLVYFVAGNFHDGRGVHRMFILAHVTPEEMRYMREHRMLYEQAIEYLGIGLLP